MRSWVTLVVLAVYALAIGILVYQAHVAASEEGPPTEVLEGVTATHRLGVNHLVREADLEGPGKSEFTGKYIVKPIQHGAVIEGGDVASMPTLGPSERALLAVPITSKLAEAGKANSEATALLCARDKPVGEAIVEAQICDGTGDEAACFVIVSLPPLHPPLGLDGLRAATETCGIAPTRATTDS